MTLAISNAHVVPIEGEPFTGTVVLAEGKIAALGPDVAVPDGAEVVDAGGRWVLPGLIDAHVHLGVHEEGEGWAGQDTNEMTDPVMAAARALDAINPRELGFDDALAGGITAVNVNPGSGNPIGGLTVALKTYGRYVDEMVLLSPSGLKAALGENPKRVYGDQKKTPSTRLGVALVLRRAFTEARNYQAKVEKAGKDGEAAEGHLVYQALVQVLNREIPWRQHCHRADDIATAIRISEEFGYQLVLDHGTESYLLADLVAEKGVPVLYGPLIVSRSKVEVRERSLAAPGILDRAGVKVSIITDHPVVPIDHLITQVALAVKEGLDPEAGLRAVTINPAEVMGVADRVGSLAPGKDADVVLWSGDPLDLRSRALRVWVGGEEVYSYDEEQRTGTVRPR
ncbi:amidohydrolase [Ornithinicoccus hortensis]|uniref:Imidazolonepropionase-like amidohydrolase n=1 Tax=Ornithinicoccus hortensis TaxID=82346 RepID=A0A542YQI4_9MICO|nr:amidohydrolase [Ornithinicoccus hortensis]TQL50360.1 imidazolonepropionase-like amidohydrolase [Ornithinicoccus hortensis]